MRTSPEARIRYLTLAAFAQAIIDGLVEFVDQGKEENLDRLLPQVRSLEAVVANRATDTPGLRALSHYEQVRTLNATSSQEEISKVIEALEQVLDKGADLSDRRNQAKRAIGFFYRLENQALRNFDEPAEVVPREIRELCNQA